MQYHAMTDAGKVRPMNEDCVFASDTTEGNLKNLFMVADGMGGHKAGEVASRLAITGILSSVRENADTDVKSIIQTALKKANQAIRDLAGKEPDKSGMGTTIVLASIDDDITVANVGDSRAYILKDGELLQVSKDHTVVEEMMRVGSLSKQAAKHHPNRHMITRAIGADETVKADFCQIDKAGVEQILLCSDGLTNMVDNESIKNVLLNSDSVPEKVMTLLQMANDNGGTDNITLLIIKL